MEKTPDIDVWDEKYTYVATADGKEDWETYGEEYEYVRQVQAEYPKRVWTLIDNNDGWYGIVAGWHFVNRLGYRITVEDWQDENEEYTIYDTTELREQWESLPVESIESIADVHVTDYENEEDMYDENFYIWEELGEQQRDRILEQYKKV